MTPTTNTAALIADARVYAEEVRDEYSGVEPDVVLALCDALERSEARVERLERVLAAEQGREGLEGWTHVFGSDRWVLRVARGSVWRSWCRNGDDNSYGYWWEVYIGDERFEGTATTALEAMTAAEQALRGDR